MPPEIKRIADKHLKDPVEVSIRLATATAATDSWSSLSTDMGTTVTSLVTTRRRPMVVRSAGQLLLAICNLLLAATRRKPLAYHGPR